jgi:WD40 repeat protein
MAQELSKVEQDRRALEIFAQACGLGAVDRSALLEQLCAGDTVVRRQVEAMLVADSGADTPVGSDAEVDGFVARQIGEMAGERKPELSVALPAVDGEYTLLRVIGEGGMGTVYEAEQHHPRRRVAIKAIRPGRITPQMSKRFEYEAQVLARLEHPNIARLYESNTQSEGEHIRAYLAMELVDGMPIDAYCCATNNLPTRDRLKLFMKVCDAVAYAHRMGVIHRDLKPANILVTREGEPKILDFGVARTVERDGQGITLVTQHGQIIGTLAYMSPEQVEGRGDVDTRADVYSLGVILYRLLTGLLPIDVSNDSIVEATRRIVTETPTWIGQHDRRLKGDLEIVVGRALEKDRARRYASVDQLRGEIDRFLTGRPIEARGDSAIYVFRKAIWRHRGPVTIVAVLLAMLTTFGIVASIQARRNRLLAVAADTARGAAMGAEVQATKRAEEFRRLLYFSNIGFAQSALQNNDMERAYKLLDGCDVSLREWEWSYLQRLRDLSSGTVDLHLARPRYASFSREGSKLVLATLDREVALLDMSSSGHAELLRERVSDGTARAAISPDGKWLAYGGIVENPSLDPRRRVLRVLQFTDDSKSIVSGASDLFVRVWDVASAAMRVAIPLGEPYPLCLQLSHDNTWAALGDSRNGLRLFDIQTGKLIRTLNGHDAPVWSLALSDDGKLLASGDNDAGTMVWDTVTGERVARADTDDGWITALCFNPDATRLALGRSDSTVRLLDLRDTATPKGVLCGHRHAIVHVDWQKDDTLHTISLDGMMKTWNAASASQVPTINTTQGESIGLAFDSTGENVFVGGLDGTVRSWDVKSAESFRPIEGRRLADHGGIVLEIAVDPIQRRIATAGRDGVIRIKPLTGDEPPLLIAPGTGAVLAIDFSPDGAKLLVGTDTEVSLWDAKTGSKLKDFSSPGVVANELRFDREGTHFYGACADGHLRRWSVDLSKPIADLLIDEHGLYDVQLSPDGEKIAVAGDTQLVALLDANTLREIRRFVGHQGGVFTVKFHPGGKRLASGGTDGTIRVWDVDTATPLITLRGHRRRIQHIAFTPSGDLLASSGDDGTIKLWRTTGHLSHGR